LIEKVIGKRIQFVTISNNFIYLYQLDGLKQKSTQDAEVVLIHFICMRWVKNCIISMLAFNIAQFFPFIKIIKRRLYFLVFNFLFFLFLYFLFLEQLGLGLEGISHTVTSVTI